MSSETITRNDLTSILNEVLPIPQGAYYDLVWQNPNGIGSMTALMSGETVLTLTKSTSSFDGFLCEFRCYYNTGKKTYGHYFTGASGMYAQTTVIREVGNPMMEFSRAWWVSGDTTISVSDCTRIVSNGSNVVGQDTGCLVPLRIWGIKLKTVGVSPMQEDYIVEQGTDGIWTYRKWSSGIAECWGRADNKTVPSGWSSSGIDLGLPFTFLTMRNWQIQHQNWQISNCYGYPTTISNTYDNINIQTYSSEAMSSAIFMVFCQGTWK